MELKTELAGLMRRSSSASCERLLFLLYIFEERCGANIESNNKDHDRLSPDDIALILRYSFPGLPPRFLFALSNSNTLLRSPDRGLSWKMVYDQESNLAAHVKKNRENVTEDSLVNHIRGLMGEDADSGKAPSTHEKGYPTLNCVNSYSESVVLAGKEGFLSVSRNRGVTFTTSENYLKPMLGEDSNVSHIAIVDDNCILAAGGCTVCRVSIAPADFDKAFFSGATVILKCKSRVCALEVVRSSSTCLQIIVAEAGRLHLSWNRGLDFISVPHKLGCIRSLDPLNALRNCEMPPFPENYMKKYIKRSKSNPLTELHQEPYEYSCGGIIENLSCFMLEELKVALGDTFRRFGRYSDIFFRNFLVMGDGTEVLSYDYTCLLCLCISISGDCVTTFSHATCVNYVPLVRSSLNDPMFCLSTVIAPDRMLFVRACSCGVSISWDMKKWEDPQFSAPVGLFVLDGNEFIVCSERNTIFIMRCNEPTKTSSHIISGNFRVHSLKRASMLY